MVITYTSREVNTLLTMPNLKSAPISATDAPTRKTWKVNKIDSADYPYIQSLKIVIEFIGPKTAEITVNGANYKVVVSEPQVLLHTTQEDQEMILRLKYGTDLFLMESYDPPLKFMDQFIYDLD